MACDVSREAEVAGVVERAEANVGPIRLSCYARTDAVDGVESPNDAWLPAEHRDPCRHADAPIDAGAVTLEVERLGLHRGEHVRFRRVDRSRWQSGTVIGVERDGSLGVRDSDGSFRAVRLDDVLVRVQGGRGGRHWEPLLERASRTEQLELF